MEGTFTRKSLGTRLRETLNARVADGTVEAWGAGNEAHGDCRLVYTVTIPSFRSITLTPGELAAWLGIPVVDA